MEIKRAIPFAAFAVALGCHPKLTPCQEVTVRIDGVDPDDPTVTLAVIVFGSPFVKLDFSAGPGDTDRQIAFTAPFAAYYYVEVSSEARRHLAVQLPVHDQLTSPRNGARQQRS